MSIYQESKKHPHGFARYGESPVSQDKERHDEGDNHHPMDNIHPHPAHHPQNKPLLPPRHDAHSHPHGDDLPDHTNPPGPIKPSKKMTKKGTE